MNVATVAFFPRFSVQNANRHGIIILHCLDKSMTNHCGFFVPVELLAPLKEAPPLSFCVPSFAWNIDITHRGTISYPKVTGQISSLKSYLERSVLLVRNTRVSHQMLKSIKFLKVVLGDPKDDGGNNVEFVSGLAKDVCVLCKIGSLGKLMWSGS